MADQQQNQNDRGREHDRGSQNQDNRGVEQFRCGNQDQGFAGGRDDQEQQDGCRGQDDSQQAEVDDNNGGRQRVTEALWVAVRTAAVVRLGKTPVRDLL